MKIWKFSPKLMLYTSKESSEHVKCRFRLKKYDLLLKKWKKLVLKKKISKGGPFEVGTVEKKNFRFSNFQNFFLKNGFNGTWQMLIETKSWNLSSFWASTEKSQEIICQGGLGETPPPLPPCRIGLTLIGMGFLDNQMYGWGRNQDEFVFELIPDHFMFKWPENNLKWMLTCWYI